MPRIIKFFHGSSQDIQSNIFQVLWSFFLSRDYFTKILIIALFLLISITPFIIYHRFDTRQRAESPLNSFRPIGVNRGGTEYKCVENDGIFDGSADEASVQAIASWKINAVRVGNMSIHFVH